MERKAIIYLPAKTAMSSGTGNTRNWILEFVTDDPKFVEPLMGWIGSRDTTRQLKMYFDTQAEAIRYADENHIAYELRAHGSRTVKPKSYANNFSATRRRYSDNANGTS